MLEGTKCVARELRGAMRGLLVLEAVKYRRSDSYLTGLGGYFANVARSGLPMFLFVLLQFPMTLCVLLLDEFYALTNLPKSI